MHEENARDKSHLAGENFILNSQPLDDAREERAKGNRGMKAENAMSSAARRRERIRQLEARLERERSRESDASRKERNGQLFVWGAMVEGAYRDGNEQDRELIRKWATRYLTDKRHLQRCKFGFTRVEEEKATSETTQGKSSVGSGL